MSSETALTVTSSRHKNGSFTLSAMPGVIMVFPRGSWSMSCTRDYMSKIVALRQQAGLKKFVCLVDSSKWQLGTPAVLEALSEFNEHAVRQGMTGQWLIDRADSAVTTQILVKALRKNVPSVEVVRDIETCVEAASAVMNLDNTKEIIRVYKQNAG